MPDELLADASAKRSAQRLSRKRVLDLLRDAPDAIILLDAQGCVLFWNHAAESLYGWSAAEARDRPIHQLLPTETLGDASSAAIGGRQSWEGEVAVSRKDGLRMRVASKWVALPEARAGEAVMLRIDRDDAARAHALASLQDRNAYLQRTVAEAHHRVRNSFQILIALLEAERADAEGRISPEAIRRLGRHLRSLAAIHDTMTQQCIAGSDVDTVSLHDTLARLLRLLQQTVGERMLVWYLDDARLSVRQAGAIALVVNELVANAIKHGAGTVEVFGAATPSSVTIDVSDEGPGFPAGFNPSAGASTGLELVDSATRWDLGGIVRYYTRSDGGARVVVRFPFSDGELPHQSGNH